MANQMIHPFWDRRVGELVEASRVGNGPKLSSAKMAKLFEAEAKGLSADDFPTPKGHAPVTACPSEPWIRKRVAFHSTSDAERDRYRLVWWPESLMSQELPWEAGAAVVELLKLYSGRGRPSVRTALWFWRVTQAAPDLEGPVRLRLAVLAAVMAGRAEPYALENFRLVERVLVEGRGQGMPQPSLTPDDWIEIGPEVYGQEAYAELRNAVNNNDELTAPRVVIRRRNRSDRGGTEVGSDGSMEGVQEDGNEG